MASNYTRIVGVASVEAYDGTASAAATLVAAYPTVISVAVAEGEVGTGILAVDTGNDIQNAYKDSYIVWEDIINNYIEVSTISVWSKADFEKYFKAVV